MTVFKLKEYNQIQVLVIPLPSELIVNIFFLFPALF